LVLSRSKSIDSILEYQWLYNGRSYEELLDVDTSATGNESTIALAFFHFKLVFFENDLQGQHP